MFFNGLDGPKQLGKWNLKSGDFCFLILYYHWLVQINGFAYWYPKHEHFIKQITTFRLFFSLKKPDIDKKYRVQL